MKSELFFKKIQHFGFLLCFCITDFREEEKNKKRREKS